MSNNTTLNVGTGGDIIQTVDNTTYKTQAVVLTNSTGTTFASVDSTNNLNVDIAAQTFYHSTGNSLVGSVVVGTPFTGTIENAFNLPNAQVLVNSTQNGTLVVNQYITSSSTTLVHTSTFAVTANVGYMQNIKVVGNYLNVVFTNNGGSTATVNIDTAYGSLTVLPPELTQNGNLKVSLQEQPASVVTGSLGALNASFNFGGTLANNTTVSVAISGTWVGTIAFYYSADGITYYSQNAWAIGGGLPVVTTTTNGQWQINAAGAKDIQVKMTSYTSGTATITLTPSIGESIVTIGNSLPPGGNIIGAVTQSGTFTVATNADGTISNGAAPTKSLIVGGVFNTTLPTLTTGQVAAHQVDSNGRQLVVISTAIPAGTNLIGKAGIDQTTVGTTNGVSIAQIGATTVVNGGVAGTLAVGGMTAVNAATTGNPLYTGGIALVAANPTAATNGQRTGIATDKVGRLLTVPGHERTMTGVQQTTITSSTTETTIVTAVASTFLDLTHLSVTNGSATATIVTLKDATAGTTRGIWNISGGGGICISFPTPLAQAAVNNNWTITCGTSVASVYVVAQFVKNI